jgi:hypothetical protein
VDAGSAARASAAARVTRVKGRVLAPAGVPMPDGVRELARDDRLWVGERDAPASPLVPLQLRRA